MIQFDSNPDARNADYALPENTAEDTERGCTDEGLAYGIRSVLDLSNALLESLETPPDNFLLSHAEGNTDELGSDEVKPDRS